MRHLALRNRILVLICSVVVIVFIMFDILLIINFRNTVQKEAIDKTKEISFHYANSVKSDIEIALISARVLAESFEGIKKITTPNRKELSEIVRQVLEKNDNFLAIFAEWGANRLDSQDRRFVNQPGNDAAGRFVPYWNRVSGPVKLDSLSGNHRFLKTVELMGREMILDPYHYEIYGKSFQVTTVLTPINSNDKIIGVVGVDLALDALKGEIDKIDIYQTGYASLISNNGFYVTDKNKDLVGTPVKDSAILKGINMAKSKGIIYVIPDQYDNILNTKTYRVFVPIKFEDSRHHGSL